MTENAGMRALHLASHYRSDANDVVAEFYVPALRVARAYSRAVGYFTSTSLALVARGLSTFLDAGGSMRLIASPQLDADDVADLDRGYALREVLTRAVTRQLAPESPRELDGLGLLGRMVAAGQLELKLAFVHRAGRTGIYHEKIGFFEDSFGERVAFTGSSNETLGGLLANFESLEVFLPWEPGEGKRVQRIVDDFERLWQNETAGLIVEEFPEVAKERIIAIGRERPFAELPGIDEALRIDAVPLGGQGLNPPVEVTLRPYQRDAVTAWSRNGGRGILKMATGTGKTKTALFAARAIAGAHRKREEAVVVVVVAPYQHLVDQWMDEFLDWGVSAVGVYENSNRWIGPASTHLQAAELGQRDLVVLVCTTASFAGQRFRALLASVNMPVLLIGDEVHNLGSQRILSLLPQQAMYRLGLSATPERWLDDTGTQGLESYFGPVIFEFDLGDAIRIGALSHYEYVPRPVELTAAETGQYVEITRKMAALIAAGADEDDDALGALLRRRAAVLGHAAGKLPLLELDLRLHAREPFQLIYCAEGRRPMDEDLLEGPAQIDQVVDLVGNRLGWPIARYVAETPRVERRRLLRRFGAGDDLAYLAAMRCLDEGVDVPDARIAYILASSSNPRQFVQRRGRILRRPPNGEKVARIYDYIAVPGVGAEVDFTTERRLMSRELQRAAEFAELADNYADTLEVLRPLKQRFQLMDL